MTLWYEFLGPVMLMAAFSRFLARIGEPQCHWFWCQLLGTC